jgi:ketosteroid isomerase-like protein
MTQPVPRAVVEAFFRVFVTRDADKIAPFLDDNVEWTINGPVDLLQYCGTRHGKAAALDVIARQVPAVFRIQRFTPDVLLIDGEWASALSRLTAVKPVDKRTVSYRVAQFIRFRDGKVVEFCAVIDSFDAVEQVLGHPLEVHESHRTNMGNLTVV